MDQRVDLGVEALEVPRRARRCAAPQIAGASPPRSRAPARRATWRRAGPHPRARPVPAPGLRPCGRTARRDRGCSRTRSARSARFARRSASAPTMPHNAAGCRTEPPVSEPNASGAMPAATAAAEPPLLPPGDALEVERVARRSVGRVLGRAAHRELVHVGSPEDHRTRAFEAGSTAVAVYGARESRRGCASRRSTGNRGARRCPSALPARRPAGPSSAPRCRARSTDSASARALSSNTSTNAPTRAIEGRDPPQERPPPRRPLAARRPRTDAAELGRRFRRQARRSTRPPPCGTRKQPARRSGALASTSCLRQPRLGLVRLARGGRWAGDRARARRPRSRPLRARRRRRGAAGSGPRPGPPARSVKRSFESSARRWTASRSMARENSSSRCPGKLCSKRQRPIPHPGLAWGTPPAYAARSSAPLEG